MLTDIYDTVVADPWPYIQGLATVIGFVWLFAKTMQWIVLPALRVPAASIALIKEVRLRITSRLIHVFGPHGLSVARGFFWTLSAIGFTAAAYLALRWHLRLQAFETAIVVSMAVMPWVAIVGMPLIRHAAQGIMAAARLVRAFHDRVDSLSSEVEAGLRQAERDILAFAVSSRAAQAEEDRKKPIPLIFKKRVPRNTLPSQEPELIGDFTVIEGPRRWRGARKTA